MSDSTRLRTYDGTVEPDAHKFARQMDELREQSGPCSDAAARIAKSFTPLPLDETALQAAEDAAPFVGRRAAALVISTYLREAGFKVERKNGFNRDYLRQVSPWEEAPVVQAESEELSKEAFHDWSTWKDDPAGVYRVCRRCGKQETRPEG